MTNKRFLNLESIPKLLTTETISTTRIKFQPLPKKFNTPIFHLLKYSHLPPPSPPPPKKKKEILTA